MSDYKPGLFDWAIGLERWQEYTDEQKAKPRSKRSSPRRGEHDRKVRAASARPGGFRSDSRGKSRPTGEDWIRWANSGGDR